MQDHLGANIHQNFRIYELWILLNWGQLFCRYFTWIFAAQISFQIRSFWLWIFVIGESRLTFWYEDFWRKYPWQFPAMNICPISRNPQPNIFFNPSCTLKTTNCRLPIFIYLYLVEKIAFRGKSNEQLNESQAGLSYADAPSFFYLDKESEAV